jgi:excisionase family DNA binding protein
VRVLSAAHGLSAAGADVFESSKRPQIRTDSVIAELALAGPQGLDETSLFRNVYGFEFETARHTGVRNTLYTRVRKRMGESGNLVREDGRIRIEVRQPFRVPDPRCSPPAEYALLNVLAKAKHMTAKEAAKMLGVPERTVQLAMQQLTEDGACRAVKVGRGLEYVLEDTTFSEPTRI